MSVRGIRRVKNLELEEQILNGASLLAIVTIFFPWVGGEWLGGKVVTYSGLGFFTSFIGIAILLLHVYIILVTLIPMTGGPSIVSKKHKHAARLIAAFLATVLLIAVWSVLTKFTFEFSRLEIHFGLYLCMIGSLISTLYAFLLFQGSKRGETLDIFHLDTSLNDAPPPPSSEPEDLRYR